MVSTVIAAGQHWDLGLPEPARIIGDGVMGSSRRRVQKARVSAAANAVAPPAALAIVLVFPVTHSSSPPGCAVSVQAPVVASVETRRSVSQQHARAGPPSRSSLRAADGLDLGGCLLSGRVAAK